MPRKYFDIDPPDIDRDGIAEAQQLVGAGSLTLDGVLADLGTAGQFDIGDSYSTGVGGVQIGIYSAGNLSGVTFTVTGLDQDGNAVAEDVTGPNNSTVETSAYFARVTDVAADGAVGADVEVGTVDEIITISYALNWRDNEPVTVAVTGLSGTCQFDVDQSFDDIADGFPTTLNWITSLSNQSADVAGSLTLHATAVRLKFDSYSSGAELQFAVLSN